ncbi:MAG: hypothetical protein Q7J35_16810 [Candidatus Methanoperedens sp.]|jgi:membrane associated rhomboid family serine protease|nr:hypothetical protein [Candidatus Methanoperedens sp.]
MIDIMDLIILQRILNIYSWLAACIIMVFMAAIALFYQKKFGKPTFFYFYIVPIIVLIIPAIQLYPFFTIEAESIEFVGSFISFAASYFLYRKMVDVK